MTKEELNTCLKSFYTSARKHDGQFYKLSSLKSIRAAQEGGVNFLAQLWECAADDLSHYDVTSEPVREISMAAKR